MLTFYMITAGLLFMLFVSASKKARSSDIFKCAVAALVWPITLIEVVLDAID